MPLSKNEEFELISLGILDAIHICGVIIMDQPQGDFLIHENVYIPDDTARLQGQFVVPQEPEGIVIFSHGAGSNFLSPRNQYVAQILQKNHFGTLLFNLLTNPETQEGRNIFNIDLLVQRLLVATLWVRERMKPDYIPIGYFGSNTGAAAAFGVAAKLQDTFAIVSRSGRVDLANKYLYMIRAPVLLLVGGNDEPVVAVNRYAQRMLPVSKLLVLPEAGHLFDEPGALEFVATNSVKWFSDSLKFVDVHAAVST